MLHAACIGCNFDIIKFLIEKEKMDVNVRDNQSCTIFHFACKCGARKDVLQYLYNQNQDFKNSRAVEGCSPILLSFQSGNLDAIKFLIEDCHIDYKNDENNKHIHPIQIAVYSDRIMVLKYLQELNKKTQDTFDYMDILLMACVGHSMTILEWLFEEVKFDVNQIDKTDLKLCVNFAESQGHKEVKEYIQSKISYSLE